ncbi:hypothetical protein [Hydrogenophaga sp. BPS33]|nr:hypothetical protein [Hydrogenophaga sp. BPS33]
MNAHPKPTAPATEWPIPDDIVCDLPDDLALYVQEHGALPEDVPGFFA